MDTLTWHEALFGFVTLAALAGNALMLWEAILDLVARELHAMNGSLARLAWSHIGTQAIRLGVCVILLCLAVAEAVAPSPLPPHLRVLQDATFTLVALALFIVAMIDRAKRHR